MKPTTDAIPYVQSYWMMNQPFDTSPELKGEHKTDVIIIGGGYAGLSSALGLLEAKPDLKLTIIDAEHLGFGDIVIGWLEATNFCAYWAGIRRSIKIGRSGC